MSGNDGPQGDDLEETARKQNSILQSLIDSIGNLLAASRELLGRLQVNLPQDRSSDAAADGDTPPEHHNDKPRHNAAAPEPTGTASTSPFPSVSC